MVVDSIWGIPLSDEAQAALDSAEQLFEQRIHEFVQKHKREVIDLAVRYGGPEDMSDEQMDAFFQWVVLVGWIWHGNIGKEEDKNE